MIVSQQEGKVCNAFLLLLEIYFQRPVSAGLGQELGLAVTELKSYYQLISQRYINGLLGKK